MYNPLDEKIFKGNFSHEADDSNFFLGCLIVIAIIGVAFIVLVFMGAIGRPKGCQMVEGEKLNFETKRYEPAQFMHCEN